MASDRERHVGTSLGHPGAGHVRDNEALDRAAVPGGALPEHEHEHEHDSLAALQRVWLASSDGSDVDAILAATRPLGHVHEEQIVQRLLREGAQARTQSSSPRSPARGRASTARPFRSARASAVRGIPRASMWVAAACLLCWLAARPSPDHDPAPARAATTAAPSESQRVRAAHVLGRAATVSAPPQAPASVRREALTDLAETYAQQQRFDEAEALFQLALTEQERRLGPAHKDIADTLTRLAALYQVQHLYAKAEPLYVRAFELDPPFAVF